VWAVFDVVEQEFQRFVVQLLLSNIIVIPLVVIDGDNIVCVVICMLWYCGLTLLEYLDVVPIEEEDGAVPFRMFVQYVICFDGDFRGFVGMIVSGFVVVAVFLYSVIVIIFAFEDIDGELYIISEFV